MTGLMYSRAVWPRLRASLLSLPGTVMTRLEPVSYTHLTLPTNREV